MVINKALYKILCLIFFIGIFSTSFTVKASHVDCDITLLDKFTGEVDCQLGDDNNDNMGGGVLDVNTHAMFDPFVWEFIEEVDIGAGMGGDEYSIAHIIDNYENFMLVFKSSNSEDTVPDTYIGYLLDNSIDMYSWVDQMFMKNGNYQGISHINLYGTGDGGSTGNCFPDCPPEVPEPQTLLIFVAALFGLIISRRKFIK